MVRKQSIIPEANIMKAVVIQAMKDYTATDSDGRHSFRDSIISWVRSMRGTFDLCAQAMSMTQEVLQEMMLKKFNRINKGETLFNRPRTPKSRERGDI